MQFSFCEGVLSAPVWCVLLWRVPIFSANFSFLRRSVVSASLARTTLARWHINFYVFVTLRYAGFHSSTQSGGHMYLSDQLSSFKMPTLTCVWQTASPSACVIGVVMRGAHAHLLFARLHPYTAITVYISFHIVDCLRAHFYANPIAV